MWRVYFYIFIFKIFYDEKVDKTKKKIIFKQRKQ